MVNDSGPSAVREATDHVNAHGIELRVSVAVEESPVLAGGPLTATWELTPVRPPVDVELGGDRVSGRVAGFSFHGRLDGSDLEFADPAEGAVELGGPVGTRQVTDSLRVPLLVNQYLTVDAAVEAIPAGEQRLLELRCHWDLVCGKGPAGAAGKGPVPIDLTLQIPLRRDDDALAALVRQQAGALLEADRQDEDALAALAALRFPGTRDLLEELGGDPGRIAWAAAAVN